MPKLGLETHVVDPEVYSNSVERFREAGLLLPTFSELTNPTQVPEVIQERLADIRPDQAHPLNLFRIHWYNGEAGGSWQDVPEFLELPETLTGVPARVVVLLADRFPLIRAHKVLATYGCLAPRVITGQFDPTRHKAVWPSTGNYCRGGVAVSRLIGCRGVAVLPEGMSQERFDWLEEWVANPADIIRTPGTESNVKEIYDRCAELEKEPENIIFNQFSEFGNYLAHFASTGQAVDRVMTDLCKTAKELRLRAYVAATGSAGTLGAGDLLKERHGSIIVAAEALECPTMLYNGFGEHNIQGIGDKHIPLIHNVMNTDMAVAVSDQSTDGLDVLFNSDVGRTYLIEQRKVPPSIVEQLGRLGLSSICNVVAAIKAAKYYGMDQRDVVVTVATDSAEMYGSERAKTMDREFKKGFDQVRAAETYGQHLLGIATDHLLELTSRERERIFNLGYFTWVEQQGVAVKDFEARRRPEFWQGLRELLPAWDDMIRKFNSQTGVLATL